MGLEPGFLSEGHTLYPNVQRPLLGPGADWRQNARLRFGRGEAYPRIRGFRVAADLIAMHVAETGLGADGLIFPFMFNWRQHIELALKQLICDAELLTGVERKPPHGHNLHQLWMRFREAAGECCSDEAAEIVEQTILELHDLDRRGDAFRYATDPEGATNLLAIDSLSFQKTGAAFSAVGNYFDAAAMMFSVELEAMSDQLVEARSYL